MNDEIPTGVPEVDRILSSKYRKSADTNPSFSKAVRDTGNLVLRKERSETIQKIPSSKTRSPMLKSKMPSKQVQVDDDEPTEADREYFARQDQIDKKRSRTLELTQKVSNGTISNAERQELFQGLPEEDDIPELVSDGFRASSPIEDEEVPKMISDGFRASAGKSKPSKKKSDKSWNERWKENNQVTDQAFNGLADGAKAIADVTKIALDKVKKSGEKLDTKVDQLVPQPSTSSPTNPDSILAEAASTNPYGIYARREHNDATGQSEVHFYKKDGKRITHKDAEYLLTPTQIKTLKHYAEYAFAGKIPSAKRRTLLPASNQNSSASTGTSIGTSTGVKGTSTGIPANGNSKYTKWQVTRPDVTKQGLVGSPKLRTLTKANTATGLTGQPATTALAGKKDASGSIAGTKNVGFGYGNNINGFGATRRDAQGSIMGTTNKNFVGVNNGTPALNKPKNAQGSIAGATSGGNIGYDAVRTVANPNRTRQTTASGLVTRHRATQQQVTAAQAAVNLSHVVTPSAMHRQAVEHEAIQEEQEFLQFNAGTKTPTKSGIHKARSATPSKITCKGVNGAVNQTRPATKSAIKPSRQKSPSRIVRQPAQVTKSAINKAKSAHYSKIVKRAVQDAGLVEAKVGRDTILIDEKELSKSGLKRKSRTKRASKIVRKPVSASPSQLKQPRTSIRYSKLVKRGA